MKSTSYEKILRGIQCEEMLLNRSKRVQAFKGALAYDVLKKQGIGDDDIYEIMADLISNSVIVKAKLIGDTKVCTVSLAKKFDREGTYIWVREPSTHLRLLVSVLAVFFLLFLAMFKLWPRSLKRVVSYTAYPALAFVVATLVLAVVRLFIFCVTFFTHSPGIWLFPNLFADVSCFESFVPLWAYHGTETNPSRKNE